LSDGSVERKQYSNPFAKPHDAWAFLLQTIAHPGQTILDPFMGQGSSIRAMINLGYNPMGIEVDEHHYNKCVVDISNLLKELHGNNVILE
jgi:site-specific DNA-methyltransferase (adenine-specific)